MPDLVLTPEQAKLMAGAAGPIAVRDTEGRLVGRLEPEWTPELIAEMKRRAAAPGPRFTGAQVQARLQALQAEWDRTGGFDQAYAMEFLARLDAADPGHYRATGQPG